MNRNPYIRSVLQRQLALYTFFERPVWDVSVAQWLKLAHILVLGAVAASVGVLPRLATIKIFTMNYVSTVVEKTRVAFIAERNIIIP